MSDRKFSYFIVFGTMRCGSNLFQQSLSQYEKITCHGELFNPAFIDGPKTADFLGMTKLDREKNPDKLIEKIILDQADGIPGFRFFEDHDQRIMDAALDDPDCAKIILRRDYLESYVSLKIAQKTDQWMLKDDSNRKETKIIFDPVEFEAYRDKLESYYSHIQNSIQTSGQTAFWISYPDQKDVSILNGVSTFLGYPQDLKKLKEITKQQNSGAWADKIENFVEFQSFVAANSNVQNAPVSVKKSMRPNIPKMVTCLSKPLLFTPIPGGPNTEILRWMGALDQVDIDQPDIQSAIDAGELLHTGHSRRTLYEWMQSNPGLISISAVRHPVARAYSVFMDKIFTIGSGSYDAIRAQLIESYEIDLPQADLSSADKWDELLESGWEQKHHRAAFHEFLKFLNKNLSGQTSIRKDGMWMPQSQFIAAFSAAVPVSLIIHEGKMDPAFRYVENLLGCEMPQLPAPVSEAHIFSLDDIYTQQTENLTRKAYGDDYARFGFADYYAALDA